jgi:hypothetical protein
MNKVISFATGRFIESQKLLEKKAYEMGADKVINYNQTSLDSNFVKKNYNILKHSRGSGYWLWKPYLILKTLEESNDDDIILYLDSGMYPIQSLKYMFDLTNNDDICLFQVHNQLNKVWTKYDCFELMGCTEQKYYNSQQVCGAPQIYKKSNRSVSFVREVFEFCKIEKLITDIPSTNNFAEFKEHRHDQSILTNVAIKNEITIYRDPSQYGNSFMDQYKNSPYPQIFNLHRGNIIMSLNQ